MFEGIDDVRLNLHIPKSDPSPAVYVSISCRKEMTTEDNKNQLVKIGDSLCIKNNKSTGK